MQNIGSDLLFVYSLFRCLLIVPLTNLNKIDVFQVLPYTIALCIELVL